MATVFSARRRHLLVPKRPLFSQSREPGRVRSSRVLCTIKLQSRPRNRSQEQYDNALSLTHGVPAHH